MYVDTQYEEEKAENRTISNNGVKYLVETGLAIYVEDYEILEENDGEDEESVVSGSSVVKISKTAEIWSQNSQERRNQFRQQKFKEKTEVALIFFAEYSKQSSSSQTFEDRQILAQGSIVQMESKSMTCFLSSKILDLSIKEILRSKAVLVKFNSLIPRNRI